MVKRATIDAVQEVEAREMAPAPEAVSVGMAGCVCGHGRAAHLTDEGDVDGCTESSVHGDGHRRCYCRGFEESPFEDADSAIPPRRRDGESVKGKTEQPTEDSAAQLYEREDGTKKPYETTVSLNGGPAMPLGEFSRRVAEVVGLRAPGEAKFYGAGIVDQATEMSRLGRSVRPVLAPRTVMELLSRCEGGSILSDLEEEFADVSRAVLAQRAAGSVTLKVSLKPVKGRKGQLVMFAEVVAKRPSFARELPSLDLWAVDGGVTDEDPQRPLPGFVDKDTGEIRYAGEVG